MFCNLDVLIQTPQCSEGFRLIERGMQSSFWVFVPLLFDDGHIYPAEYALLNRM